MSMNPVTGPVRCSVPSGPCWAGTAVIVTAPTCRDSHGRRPTADPRSRCAATGVVSVSGAVATYLRPPWSRLSGCWSWERSTASTGPTCCGVHGASVVFVKTREPIGYSCGESKPASLDTSSGTGGVTTSSPDFLAGDVTSAAGAAAAGTTAAASGPTAYVANSGTDTVTPINTATNTAGTPIKVGAYPQAIAVTPNGATAYVASSGTDTVTPINTATNTAGAPITNTAGTTFKVAGTGIAVAPDGATAYVTDYGSEVIPISTATNTSGTPITAGSSTFGIAITPDGATAYVTNFESNTVTPVNLATSTAGTPITVGPVGSEPDAIAIAGG
jgi:YVTN family beta-propeller protein